MLALPSSKLIGVGLAAAGLLALVITIYAYGQRIDALRARLTAEQTAHAVTRDSLQQVRQLSARYIREGEEREVRAADALDRAIAASRGAVRDAAAIAARAPSGTCSSEHLKGVGL